MGLIEESFVPFEGVFVADFFTLGLGVFVSVGIVEGSEVGVSVSGGLAKAPARGKRVIAANATAKRDLDMR
ncbi:MAG: hypothetical protein WCA35_12895 [Kovacikia sp.]